MSASASFPAIEPAHPPLRLRFGRGLQPGEPGGVEWVFKRNCSISPRQLLAAYAGLSAVSLGVAGFFWLHGAVLVIVFAGIELVAVAVAMLVWARHAADRERIVLQAGRLQVECLEGGRSESFEFAPERVRIERREGKALVSLSSGGREVEVGRHVRPELRALLAEELRTVLRRGPGLTGLAGMAQSR